MKQENKNSVSFSLKEFTDLVEMLTNGLKTVACEHSPHIIHSKKADIEKKYDNRDMMDVLTNHFNRKFISWHTENKGDHVLIWLIFEEQIEPLKTIDAGDAIDLILAQYRKEHDLPNDHQFDCEDSPMVGNFGNAMVIINIKDDVPDDEALHIQIKYGSTVMHFDQNIGTLLGK